MVTSPLPSDPPKVACFKRAPVTSVEVERSLSVYKASLVDNRGRLTAEHLEQSSILLQHADTLTRTKVVQFLNISIIGVCEKCCFA